MNSNCCVFFAILILFGFTTEIIEAQEQSKRESNKLQCSSEKGDIMTDEETKAVNKLRPLVEDLLTKDYMKRDEYLVRFLRVRNFDILRTKEMIVAAMAWRKENNIDNILLEDLNLVENEFPVILTEDKCGRPLMIANIANADIRKVALSGRMEKFIHLLATAMEIAEGILYEIYLEANATDQTTNTSRAFVLIDMSGYNLRQHACVQCLSVIPRVFGNYERFYPDLFYRFYTVNTPRIFLPVFDLMRPFLAPTTQRAVHLFDHNVHKWKEVLLSEVPAYKLPKLYGGNRTDMVLTSLPQLRRSHQYVKAIYDKLALQSTKVQ